MRSPPRLTTVAGDGEAALPWLSVHAGSLVDTQGRALRLMGLQGGAADGLRDLQDLQALLPTVPPGRRCVSWPLQHAAQLKPAALSALADTVAAHAAAGVYTLLRISARLWLHGHHLALARRFCANPAVLYGLMGRQHLADRLARAAQALRQVHPAACVWLPLESAHVALASRSAPSIGLLWDARHPQAPRLSGLAAGSQAPVLLDGWQPGPQQALADERLARLCREAQIGWLVRSEFPWRTPVRGGQAEPGRAARVLQRLMLHALDAEEAAAAAAAAAAAG